MDSGEEQMLAWSNVPKHKARKNLGYKKRKTVIQNVDPDTAIQKTGYSNKELENIRNRLLQRTSFREFFSDLSFTSSYQQWVYSMWNYHNWKNKDFTLRDDFIMCTGLPGEVGEVLEIVKKLERDGVKLTPEKRAKMKQKLRLELGDVLYYLIMIASRQGISFDTIIKENVLKLEKRKEKKYKSKKHTKNCHCPRCLGC